MRTPPPPSTPNPQPNPTSATPVTLLEHPDHPGRLAGWVDGLHGGGSGAGASAGVVVSCEFVRGLDPPREQVQALSPGLRLRMDLGSSIQFVSFNPISCFSDPY